jgi:hypothetical protein
MRIISAASAGNEINSSSKDQRVYLSKLNRLLGFRSHCGPTGRLSSRSTGEILRTASQNSEFLMIAMVPAAPKGVRLLDNNQWYDELYGVVRPPLTASLRGRGSRSFSSYAGERGAARRAGTWRRARLVGIVEAFEADRRLAGKVDRESKVAAHGLDLAALRREHEVAALFELGDRGLAPLIDSQG